MSNATNYVELKDINKYFGSFHASKDINLSIPQGKLVALLGPSGSGKTTILRMIAGLEAPDSGDIIINGKVVNDVPGSERGVGFVFQNYALFRYMTVYDNIAFGLKVKKWKKADIEQRVKELIQLINCEGLEKRYPRTAGCGMRSIGAVRPLSGWIWTAGIMCCSQVSGTNRFTCSIRTIRKKPLLIPPSR